MDTTITAAAAESSLLLAAQLADLRRVPLLSDLAEDDLAWLAERGEWRGFGDGETVFRLGDPADAMYAVVEGEIHARRPQFGEEVVYVAPTGEITGKLPFSRMTEFAGTGRAIGRVRIVRWRTELFPAMLHRIPVLEARLIATMMDRVRETTRGDSQRERLVSLGRLSAGLAHELNNPASAAQRAAAQLADALRDEQRWTARLAERVGAEGVESAGRCLGDLRPGQELDPLSRSDREEAVGEWLDAHGAAESWQLAPTLVEAGVDPAWLDRLAAELPADAVPTAACWTESTLRVSDLLGVVRGSAERISELVEAVKAYTYMDQAPSGAVDIHSGLDSTLAILGPKLNGRRVTREYAPDLPHVQAVGGELNQVWTNLLDNAAYAAGEGGEIRIRTSRPDPEHVQVEIADNGPGIPAEVQTRIWEPFFTTKAQGQGTGLGLDIARRLVEHHRGELKAESRPGDTRFRVRLPLHPLGGG